MKQRILDWYNRHIVAGWYRSAALVVGWLTSAILFLPDLAQFVITYWGLLGSIALPTFSAEIKALLLGVFVTFIAPPLRAWQQEKMREAAKKQEAARLAAGIKGPT